MDQKLRIQETNQLPWQTPSGNTITAPVLHEDGTPITPDNLRAVEAVAAGELSGEAGLQENYDEMLQSADTEQIPRYTMFDQIPNRPVEWLWADRLPCGMFSLLVGEPGVGKTHVACDIAARVSTGAEWPDGRGKAPHGAVIILTAEDSPSSTIGPRLTAAEADRSRIAFFSGVKLLPSALRDRRAASIAMFDPMTSLNSLDKMIRSLQSKFTQVPLIIIDPITSYLGEADQNTTADVRASLNMLSMVAMRHGTAIVGINHFNKNPAGSAQSGILGSTAFAALARAASMVGHEPESDYLYFVPVKSNLAQIPTKDAGLQFRLDSVLVDECCSTARVRWCGPTSKTADQLRHAPTTRKHQEERRADTLSSWLLAQLPCSQQVLLARGGVSHYSASTIKDRLKLLKVVSTQLGKNRNAGVWLESPKSA
jgi:putative DNA primase/helicase